MQIGPLGRRERALAQPVVRGQDRGSLVQPESVQRGPQAGQQAQASAQRLCCHCWSGCDRCKLG